MEISLEKETKEIKKCNPGLQPFVPGHFAQYDEKGQQYGVVQAPPEQIRVLTTNQVREGFDRGIKVAFCLFGQVKRQEQQPLKGENDY